MTEKLTWHQALKNFNEKRKAEGGNYIIPKRGSDEYLSIRHLMGDDAKPLKENKPVKDRSVHIQPHFIDLVDQTTGDVLHTVHFDNT